MCRVSIYSRSQSALEMAALYDLIKKQKKQKENSQQSQWCISSIPYSAFLYRCTFTMACRGLFISRDFGRRRCVNLWKWSVQISVTPAISPQVNWCKIWLYVMTDAKRVPPIKSQSYPIQIRERPLQRLASMTSPTNHPAWKIAEKTDHEYMLK